MAKHLDLEEQEQLDALKHFWERWGNLITWLLIAVLGAYAGWTGWQYWQRQQGAAASAIYEEMSRSVAAGDVARVERTLADMKDKYGGTTYAAHAGLLSAKVLAEKGKPAEAKAALAAVADKAPNDGLRAVARLRLASVQIGEKAYDDALKTLSGSFPAQYTALVADRRGDVLAAQGKREEARTAYREALDKLEAGSPLRRLIDAKLDGLGGVGS